MKYRCEMGTRIRVSPLSEILRLKRISIFSGCLGGDGWQSGFFMSLFIAHFLKKYALFFPQVESCPQLGSCKMIPGLPSLSLLAFKPQGGVSFHTCVPRGRGYTLVPTPSCSFCLGSKGFLNYYSVFGPVIP